MDWIDNSRGVIGYNDNNEVIIDGERVPNSNLTDMITWLVGSRKRNPPMPGLNSWMNALSRLGLPRSIIKEESRLRALENGTVSSNLDPTLTVSAVNKKKMNDSAAGSIEDEDWTTLSRGKKKKQEKKKQNSKRRNKKEAALRGNGGRVWKPKKRYKKNVLTPDNATFRRWLGSLTSVAST